MEKMLRTLSRYGRQIALPKKGLSVQGFLQPVTGKGTNMAHVEASPLGVQQHRQYVYIGPVEPELKMDDVLQVDGMRYLVRRAERIAMGQSVAYQWAMCVARGGDDQWGMDTSG